MLSALDDKSPVMSDINPSSEANAEDVVMKAAPTGVESDIFTADQNHLEKTRQRLTAKQLLSQHSGIL
jgi:hypothetical protein